MRITNLGKQFSKHKNGHKKSCPSREPMIDLSKYPKFAADSRLVKRWAFLETEWRRAYPQVDLDKQIGWAYSWLVTSGKKYSDMARFLNNWWKRCAQDLDKASASVGPIRMPTLPYKEEIPREEEIMTGDDIKRIREAL